MREILFRGQTRKLGEKVYMTGEKVPGNWVYGGIFQGKGCYSVMYGCPDADDITGATLEKHVVYTDTVGQFTGLTDKNGVQMWEGDIIKGLFYHERPILAVVKFKDGAFGLEWNRSGAKTFYAFTSLCNVQYEKLGNIYDNPELIGGTDNG